MEVMRSNWFVSCCRWLVCMLLMLVGNIDLQAQPGFMNYSIKHGRMYIALGRNLPDAAIDSFSIKYGLEDLKLAQFVKTPDSLTKMGWKLELNNSEAFVISKPLFSSDNMIDPREKILFSTDAEPRNLAGAERPHFGFNRFKNKNEFEVSDSIVRFYLRGQTNASRVNLAGSFNNWNDTGIRMIRTDSGWISDVKLGAGKHLYKFIIDGKWVIDKDNTNKENDGMGNDNSVYYRWNHIFKLEGYNSAKKVYVAGSFNGWDENSMQMTRTATGWMLPVYLPQGTYTYRFIADGKWFSDPANPDKMPNEFNDFNSVIRFGKPHVFRLDGFTGASVIELVGSFNDWREKELLMQKTATGWELPYVLGAGNYEYRLKIDGNYYKPDDGKENFFLVIDPNFTFRLKGHANAKKVFLAGDLNNWNPQSFEMKRVGDEWIFEAHLDPGKHRYKFVVDGNWILDPANKLWEQNEHETGNSIIWIERE